MNSELTMAPELAELVERLATHRTIGKAPRSELEWLAAHGQLQRYEAGEYIVRKGQRVEDGGIGLEILLAGRFAIHVDRGAGPRRVMEWHGGDVAGLLPFSRMTSIPGDSVSEIPVETLSISPELFPELIRDCPTVTGFCVHVMLDRARVFTTSDLQDEKMASLGKLASGLAHEMDNPASAVTRIGKVLRRLAVQVEASVRELNLAHLTAEQVECIDRTRAKLIDSAAPPELDALERAEREDELSAWLLEHGAGEDDLEALLETGVTLADLEELASSLGAGPLSAVLNWIAAACAVRALAAENERAGARISTIVGAMKRLTHLDRAPVAERLDLERGLKDTITILSHKIRSKSIAVALEIAPDLPPVYAIGGELSQVWINLLENALDASPAGGHVVVGAAPSGGMMVVRFIDEGPGVKPEHANRIFDPFFTTKPPGEGTGLGLEVARAMVRGNGGDIDFESRPGRTEFRVFLPLHQAEDGPREG